MSHMSSESCAAGGDDARGTVFNIQRFSIEDGPGIRTTVFMKGCPLKCTWCHNPEGLDARPQLMWFDARCIGDRGCLEVCPRNALDLSRDGMRIDREKCDACGDCVAECPSGALEVCGRECTTVEVFDEVMRDEAFYRNSGGGVTVSGGEPSMQPRFVHELLVLCREAGIHTALDTCGYCPTGTLEMLLASSDMVLLDLKLMDDNAHRELTGMPVEPVIESARTITRAGKPLWVRTPIIPGCTDTIENVTALAEFISKELATVSRWDLLAFNNTCGSKYDRLSMSWSHDGVPLLEKSKMESLARAAAVCGVEEIYWSGATAAEH